MCVSRRSFIAVGLLGAMLAAAGVSHAETNQAATLIRDLASDQGKDQAQDQTASDQDGEKKLSDRELRTATRTIDKYLQRAWSKHDVKPRPVVDDKVFLRRAFLKIGGRIPTIEDTLAFLRSDAPNKRQRLIDQLLGSAAYVSHFFNWWADILRIRTDMDGGRAYAAWVKQALRKNMPYDKFVRELVTSSGYVWKNGAAGYYLRDQDMPLSNVAMTSQVFLGTWLRCAQCHDHPFDAWSRKEFYQITAYMNGWNANVGLPKNLKKAKSQLSDYGPKEILEDLAGPLDDGIRYSPATTRLPEDYQYDNGKPNQVVKPYTIFGNVPKLDKYSNPREAFAAWMTSPDNPRFTEVIVNRLWKQAFGRALYEPVDRIQPSTEAVFPRLMDYLKYKMIDLDYDVQAFLRILYNTKAFQRAVPTKDPPTDEPYYFPGPVLQRMSAEQLWDSMMTLIVPKVDQRKGPSSRTRQTVRTKLLRNADPKKIAALAKKRAEYREKRNELNKKIREAKEAGERGTVRSLRKERRSLEKPSLRDFLATEEVKEKLKYADGSMNKMSGSKWGSYGDKDSPWSEYPSGFKRASELPSPVGQTHFMQRFGQSERRLINNDNRRPSTLQVLTMFNGRIVAQLSKKRSVLMKNIRSAGSQRSVIDTIFLTILNRHPTARERRLTSKALRAGKRPRYDRVIWALVNTREFSFVR